MTRPRIVFVALALLGLGGTAVVPALAQGGEAAADAAPQPNDYGNADNWLCRPGREDACAVDLTTTVVAADGTLSEETWAPDPDAPIDCFYAYPTASRDTTPNSDMIPGPGETGVVGQHLARFGSLCRLYAPMYRSVTLMGIRSLFVGDGTTVDGDLELGYNDLVDAWNYYLEHENNGRGVVLISHSQGTVNLIRLIANEIDGKPVQDRLISALLIGHNVAVPPGKDVGGSFQHIPLCREKGQTGCVVTYVSFRDTLPAADNSLFGRVPDQPGMVSGCTNPAALAGGEAALHSYMASSGRGPATVWVEGQEIDTPWVSLPGLIEGECVSKNGATYLELSVNADPSDPRVDDIPGDIVIGGEPNQRWGMHVVDVNVALGDLIDLVSAQSEAYLAQQ